MREQVLQAAAAYADAKQLVRCRAGAVSHHRAGIGLGSTQCTPRIGSLLLRDLRRCPAAATDNLAQPRLFFGKPTTFLLNFC